MNLSDHEVDRFRDAILQRFGLEFEDRKRDVLRGTLEERLEATRAVSVDAYLLRLLDPHDDLEVRDLAPALVVGETYFFRNQPQLDVFADEALPKALDRAANRPVRVLSAGCSSGEEAYSLAMMVHERHPEASERVQILGIDVSPPMIERARAASYGDWSLRGTPAEWRTRFFLRQGALYRVLPEISRMVTFRVRNLIDEDELFWAPGAFDVVFCRNVLIYLSQEARVALVDRFARVLSPGGHLFLGHAETLRGISDDFEVHHSQNTFFYVRGGGAGRPAASRRSAPAMVLPPSLRGTPPPPQMPSPSPEAPPARAPAVAPPPEAPELPRRATMAEVLALVKEEQFEEALGTTERLDPAREGAERVLLARGAVLAIRGEVSQAEAVCRRVIGLDPGSADGQYLFAFCRAQSGDLPAARQAYERAVTLDPFFSLPHLQLGLMARRSGDADRAMQELSQALARLPDEEELRLVLFGGGFTRSALEQLCRAELQALRRGS